jgi:hypothetical protein
MSFIQKSDAVVINTKLTNIGRLLLASGSLTFKKIEFGDSEIDYTLIRDDSPILTGDDFIVLRPRDANPNIKHPIPISNGNTDTKTNVNLQSFPNQVTNTANQRGFFTGSTSAGFTALTSSTYIKGFTTISTSGVTGGTVMTLDSVSGLSIGDMILVDWRNPKLVSFTSTTGTIGEAFPRQFIWYKVQSIGGNNVTVDRTLPRFNGNGGSLKSVVYFYPANNAIDNYYSTGTTVGYWNYNTLSFDSTCNIGSNDNVPVWNLNIVYKDTPAGVTNGYTTEYYDGAIFSGFKEYIQGSSTSSTKSQFAVIHYTNKSISNYYGEGFLNNTFNLTLPTIMYHGKTDRSMGIVLSATTIKRVQPTTLTGFTTEYYDLVETTSQNIVGKVFNDLRIAVIEDEELVNVLALKSDRSHTLPSPEWQATNVTSNALLSTYSTNPTEYLALTYLFTNENAYSNGYDTNASLGLRGGIHCGYIKYINQITTSAQNVRFDFNDSDLKFMIPDVSSSDGTGFNVNKFYILAQKVTFGSEPNPATWTLIDYTPNLTDYAVWGATRNIPVTALTRTIYPLDNNHYTAGTAYDITSIIGTIPTTLNYASTTQLGFGEESIFLGNVNTNIKATVYKTKITQNLNYIQYNTTSNPTYSIPLGNSDIFITEAGIYDDNNNLVAIGKLSNPLKKNSLRLLTVEIDMDF